MYSGYNLNFNEGTCTSGFHKRYDIEEKTPIGEWKRIGEMETTGSFFVAPTMPGKHEYRVLLHYASGAESYYSSAKSVTVPYCSELDDGVCMPYDVCCDSYENYGPAFCSTGFCCKGCLDMDEDSVCDCSEEPGCFDPDFALLDECKVNASGCIISCDCSSIIRNNCEPGVTNGLCSFCETTNDCRSPETCPGGCETGCAEKQAQCIGGISDSYCSSGVCCKTCKDEDMDKVCDEDDACIFTPFSCRDYVDSDGCLEECACLPDKESCEPDIFDRHRAEVKSAGCEWCAYTSSCISKTEPCSPAGVALCTDSGYLCMDDCGTYPQIYGKSCPSGKQCCSPPLQSYDCCDYQTQYCSSSMVEGCDCLSGEICCRGTCTQRKPSSVITLEKRITEIGSYMEFDGTASKSPDGYVTSYEWDLGAGGVSSHEPKVRYSYQEPGQYLVSLEVEGNGESDTDDVIVFVTGPDLTVQEALESPDYYLFHFYNPAEGDSLRAGSSTNFVVYAEDANMQPAEGLDVSLDFLDIRTPMDDVGAGMYSARYDVPINTRPGTYPARAFLDGEETSSIIDITVLSPGFSMEVTLLPESKYADFTYLPGDYISEVLLKPVYPDGSSVELESVNGVLTSSSRGAEELSFSPAGGYYSAKPEFTIRSDDMPSLDLQLEARDVFGHTTEQSLKLMILGEADKTLFDLQVLKPKTTGKYPRGFNLPFEVRPIETAPGYALSNVEVTVYDDSGSTELELAESEGFHTGRYMIKTNDVEPLSFIFRGIADVTSSGKTVRYESVKRLRIPIDDVLKVQSMSNDTLNFSITYSDGKIVDDERLSARINGLPAVLQKAGDFFVSDTYPSPRSGFFMAVEDSHGNSGDILVQPRPSPEKHPDNTWLLALLLIFLALCYAAYDRFRMKLMKKEASQRDEQAHEEMLEKRKEDLTDQKEELEALIKKTKYDFFKRRISEQQANKNLSEYEAKLARIKTKLSGL